MSNLNNLYKHYLLTLSDPQLASNKWFKKALEKTAAKYESEHGKHAKHPRWLIRKLKSMRTKRKMKKNVNVLRKAWNINRALSSPTSSRLVHDPTIPQTNTTPPQPEERFKEIESNQPAVQSSNANKNKHKNNIQEEEMTILRNLFSQLTSTMSPDQRLFLLKQAQETLDTNKMKTYATQISDMLKEAAQFSHNKPPSHQLGATVLSLYHQTLKPESMLHPKGRLAGSGFRTLMGYLRQFLPQTAKDFQMNMSTYQKQIKSISKK